MIKILHKTLLLLLLPMLLFSVQIFPENSQQFTAYGTVAMGGECGYEISAIIIDAINPELSQVKKSVICITAGVAISSLTQYLLRDHYEPEEESWCLTGRGHWIVFRVGVDTIKGLTRKKERKATLEKWKEETIEFN